jgi:hypothetical protein
MKPACREKGKYKGVERMKPDSNANAGTFRRIAGRVVTAACAVALTVGLAGCGNSTAGTVTLDFFQFKSEAADWFTAKAREFEKIMIAGESSFIAKLGIDNLRNGINMYRHSQAAPVDFEIAEHDWSLWSKAAAAQAIRQYVG